MKQSAIIYDSFNARYLTFIEVARSFIWNDHFAKLIQNNSSMLMGPRGCGKTTLLKMLNIAALTEYDRLNGTSLCKQIPFRSIYIPTDIQWKRQVDVLEKTIEDPKIVVLIGKCTVTITVLSALCHTFSEILHYELNIDGVTELEVNLSKMLVDSWKLEKPIVPTLKSIEIKLITMMSELNAKINRHLLLGEAIEIPDLFHNEFFDLLHLGCEIFSSIVPLPPKKWALSFDELEIAPSWLQNELLQSLRSKHQHYLFKLTTAPIVNLYQEVETSNDSVKPSDGNDYNIIKVWTSDQQELKQWRRFCSDLMLKKIQRINMSNKEYAPIDILGESFLDFSIKEAYPKEKLDFESEDYSEGSVSWFAFKELAKDDLSFRIFLMKKGINPDNPVPVRKSQIDEVFRKVKQLVYFRLHLRAPKDKLRSRKVVPLYFGLNSVFEFCDGNPRILVGLVDEFVNMALLPDGQFRKIGINEQFRVLERLSERYLRVLSSHPDATVNLTSGNYNIADLINQIAVFNYRKAIVEHFKMDQVGSFIVDQEMANKLLPLIEIGLYLGAFVYVGRSHSIGHNELVNKEFRLSYTLAPYFKLIPRNNKQVRISSILNDRQNSQQSLFDQL